MSVEFFSSSSYINFVTYLRILLGIDRESSIRATLIKGSSGVFVSMVIASISNFVLSLVLARILGPDAYGMVVYATTLVWFMMIPTVMGLDKLLVRNIAAYSTQQHWSLIKGLIRFAHRWVSANAILFMIGAAAISWFVLNDSNSLFIQTFLFALILLPLISLNILRQSALRGFHKIIYAQIPEVTTTPIFVILILIAYWGLKLKITPQKAICFNIAAAAITLSLGIYCLAKLIPMEVKKTSPSYLVKKWMRDALPLMLIGSIQMVNSQADILMLGALHNKEVVGIYSVARRGAVLIIFILQAANSAMAPILSSVYAKGELKKLQEIITRGIRIITILSFPIAIGMILFGNFYLKLFGSAFTLGKPALIILSISQLAILTMGSAAMVLVITGHEREAVWGIGIGAGANVVMNALLIPQWGIIGAAIATALSNIIWCFILAWLAYNRLGIVVFPINFGLKT